MPKISVITPVYNAEKYLEKCLDSVTNQTLKDIEIICINDCSTDNSPKILQAYATKDNRIKIITPDNKCDVSKARNIGINSAIGKYVGFVDADDTIDLNFYEKLYKKAEDTGAEIVKGVFNIIAGRHSFKTDFNIKIKRNKTYFYAEFTTAIYKTSFLKNNNLYFNEKLSTWEDPLFSIMATKMCRHLELENSVCYNYFRRLGSKSHKAEREDVEQWIEAMKLYLTYPETEEDYLIILKDLITTLFFTSLYNVKTKEDKEFAISKFSEILELKPEYTFERDVHKMQKKWNKMKLELMAHKLRKNL